MIHSEVWYSVRRVLRVFTNDAATAAAATSIFDAISRQQRLDKKRCRHDADDFTTDVNYSRVHTTYLMSLRVLLLHTQHHGYTDWSLWQLTVLYAADWTRRPANHTSSSLAE